MWDISNLFHPPPQKELEFVDVPFFTQGADVPESLLVQLDKEDLSSMSEDRLNSIWSQRYLTVETIQANSGFDPRGQIELAKHIEANLRGSHETLGWRGLPRYEQLKGSLELAWEHFGTKATSDVRSASQLTLKLWNYAKNPDFKNQINLAMSGAENTKSDEALEGFLDFSRQWVSFRAPRMLVALERIQSEVFARHRYPTGNYAFYCSQLESLFLNPVVVALDEYGVPLQLAKRVVRMLREPQTLDEALDRLKVTSVQAFDGLSHFERRLLEPLCRSDS